MCVLYCFPCCGVVTFPAEEMYDEIAYLLKLTKQHTQTEIELALLKETAAQEKMEEINELICADEENKNTKQAPILVAICYFVSRLLQRTNFP